MGAVLLGVCFLRCACRAASAIVWCILCMAKRDFDKAHYRPRPQPSFARNPYTSSLPYQFSRHCRASSAYSPPHSGRSWPSASRTFAVHTAVARRRRPRAPATPLPRSRRCPPPSVCEVAQRPSSHDSAAEASESPLCSGQPAGWHFATWRQREQKGMRARRISREAPPADAPSLVADMLDGNLKGQKRERSLLLLGTG
jgi:hypothetical protein